MGNVAVAASGNDEDEPNEAGGGVNGDGLLAFGTDDEVDNVRAV